VIGAASAEGVAVARLLSSLGFDVVLHDMRPRSELRKAFRTTHGAYSREEQDALWDELEPLVARGRFEDDYLSGIEPDAVVSLGQGWYLVPENQERIAKAVPASALIISMTALYFALANGPIAGITGTNGKSTTVALTDTLLTVAGVSHAVAGNERSNKQFLPSIDSLPPDTWLLLEVSNRQLLQLPWSPRVSAITSLTPDHLEEHGGLDGYVSAKRRLFEHQTPADIAITPDKDVNCAQIVASGSAQVVRCGCEPIDGPSVYWEDDLLVACDVPLADGTSLPGRTELAQREDLQLPGSHNLINAAIAAAMALACGADPSSIARALRQFEGKALRLQRLAAVRGVEVWSDIKSTTPEATLAAIEALSDRPLVLIAGGDDKGLSYDQLGAVIVERGVQTILVPGSASDKLAAAIGRAQGEDPATDRVSSLDAALDQAFSCASTGAAIVVSPAAAGFWTTQLQGKPSLRALVQRRAQRDPAVVPHTT
jgi:UDP-N-acetylmuramoylalanine--D-glutamate ligase